MAQFRISVDELTMNLSRLNSSCTEFRHNIDKLKKAEDGLNQCWEGSSKEELILIQQDQQELLEKISAHVHIYSKSIQALLGSYRALDEEFGSMLNSVQEDN